MPFHRDRYSDFTAQLGGPILKDKLWLFGSYQYRLDRSSLPGTDPDYPGEVDVHRLYSKMSSTSPVPKNSLTFSLANEWYETGGGGSSLQAPSTVANEHGIDPCPEPDLELDSQQQHHVRSALHRLLRHGPSGPPPFGRASDQAALPRPAERRSNRGDSAVVRPQYSPPHGTLGETFAPRRPFPRREPRLPLRRAVHHRGFRDCPGIQRLHLYLRRGAAVRAGLVAVRDGRLQRRSGPLCGRYPIGSAIACR